MAMMTPGRNTDYDAIDDSFSNDDKINVAINVIRKTNGPTILDYNKLRISRENYGLFDAKLKKTRFVTFTQSETAYHPTYFMSDDGLMWMEEYGTFLNYQNSKNKSEELQFKGNKVTILDMLSKLKSPFINTFQFIHKERIEALEKITNTQFDLSKLLKLCKEINDNYELGNYYSAGALVRIILDHVPPLLEQKSFDEIANNYGGRSFKEMMQHLSKVSKNIGNIIIHAQVKSHETLPNELTIDCKQALDVLLGEIINKLNSK